MGKHKKKPTDRSSRPANRSEHRSEPEDIGIKKSFNSNGESFILSDNASGDSGWYHISTKHFGPVGSTADTKFPDRTTEKEVLELIEKTIVNGKWYPKTDSAEAGKPARKKRVYLWDSRADRSASERGIYQMCVVTTNEKSKQQSIITAYPRYGEGIGGDNNRRNDDLDRGKIVSNITNSIAQSVATMRANLEQLNQDIIIHKHEQKIGDEQFLNDLSETQTKLSTELETARGLLNTARSAYTRFRLRNRDRDLNDLVSNDINTVGSSIGDTKRSIDDLQTSIDDGYKQLTAGADAEVQPSQPQPETPRPQDTGQTEGIEAKKNIQKVDAKIGNISDTLDGWSKKRSKVVVDTADIPLIYSSESNYTHHEYREKLLESQTNVRKLNNEQERISRRVDALLNETKELGGTHARIQNIERRVNDDREDAERTIALGLEFITEKLNEVQREIDTYRNTGKDPSAEVAESEQNLRAMLDNIKKDKNYGDDQWKSLTKQAAIALEAENIVNSLHTGRPQAPRRTRRAPTYRSVHDTGLETLRGTPHGKELLSITYFGSNDSRQGADDTVRDAEQQVHRLMYNFKHMSDGAAARSHMQTAKDTIAAIRANKSEIDATSSRIHDSIKHVFPDIDSVNPEESMAKFLTDVQASEGNVIESLTRRGMSSEDIQELLSHVQIQDT